MSDLRGPSMRIFCTKAAAIAEIEMPRRGFLKPHCELAKNTSWMAELLKLRKWRTEKRPPFKLQEKYTHPWLGFPWSWPYQCYFSSHHGKSDLKSPPKRPKLCPPKKEFSILPLFSKMKRFYGQIRRPPTHTPSFRMLVSIAHHFFKMGKLPLKGIVVSPVRPPKMAEEATTMLVRIEGQVYVVLLAFNPFSH